MVWIIIILHYSIRNVILPCNEYYKTSCTGKSIFSNRIKNQILAIDNLQSLFSFNKTIFSKINK